MDLVITSEVSYGLAAAFQTASGLSEIDFLIAAQVVREAISKEYCVTSFSKNRGISLSMTGSWLILFAFALAACLSARLPAQELSGTKGGLAGVVSTAVKARIVEALFRLAADPETSFAARALVTAKLHAIAQSQPPDASGGQIKRRVADFERDPGKFKPQQVMKMPPGSPIGDDEIF